MAGRPRKNEKEKAKSRNGTGTITTSPQKVPRPKRKEKMCKICSECKDRSICNNRVGTDKCDKCSKCRDKKGCDRFYIYLTPRAFTPQVNGKRKYIGKYESQEQAQNSINEVKNGGFAEKSNATLYNVLAKKNAERLNSNQIIKNTDDRNESLRNKMRKYGIADKPIQKIKTQEIQDYLNSLKDDYSQSEIDKHTNEINSGFKYAIKHQILLKNPCDDLNPVFSSLSVKNARPFELDEQNLLLDYIETHNKLTDSRSTMDDITFRNIVRLAFISGQRIGELLALKIGFDKKHYTSDIDFEKEIFKISKTITRENNRFVLGKTTKNSKKRTKKGLPDYREISFNVARKGVISGIFTEQIEHSKTFENNTQHFLFCNSNGDFITPSQVTTTLKRICRKLHIQEDNPDGCFVHQARHSFVCRCLESRNKNRNYCRPYC